MIRNKKRVLPQCVAAAALLLSSCSMDDWNADLAEFVDNGLSMVDMRSVSFSAADGTSGTRFASGTTITGEVAVVNPKEFDVTYSLSWDPPGFFAVDPPAAPVQSDPNRVAFSFVFDESAEHRTVTFTLGKHAGAINKTYPTETFSVLCDSPPNAAADLAASMDGDRKSTLSFTAPNQVSDDDLDRAEIAWTKHSVLSPAGGSGTISPLVPGAAYSFVPPGCAPGYSYSYSITLYDLSGQRSAAASATSAAHDYSLSYDGNGSDGGSAPPAAAVPAETLISAAANSFTRAGYAFLGWNTEPGGTGTAYATGASFRMPAADRVLYAQWSNSGVLVEFDLGEQGLVFSPGTISVLRGDVLTIACTNPDLAGARFAWYEDGVEIGAEEGPSFTWATAGKAPGQYVISCTATYGGMTYSGQVRATITY